MTSSNCGAADEIVLFASTTVPQSPGSPSQFTLTIPRREAYFTGTGDLFGALLLVRLHENPLQLATAVELVVASVQAVLATTVDAAGTAMKRQDGSAAISAARELRLIQSQDAILRPLVLHKATPAVLC